MSNENNDKVKRLGGFAYAVVYSDGWVKVGRGKNPEARVLAHNSSSKMRGADYVASCFSGRLLCPEKAEKRLINFCIAHGSPAHGREWFSGVDFSDLVKIIEGEFPGDKDEDFLKDQESRRGLERVCESKLDEMFKQDRDWKRACYSAEILMEILVLSGCKGDSFKINEKGYIPFLLDCSLAIHGCSKEELAIIFMQASLDPDGGIETIRAKSRKLVALYLSGESV